MWLIHFIYRRNFKDNLRQSFNSAHFFSVLSDGSTDSGAIKQEAIYVRYLENGCSQTKFAGIKPPIKGDAEGLLLAIEDVLKSLRAQGSTPFEKDEYLTEIYKKLVNCNFDGTSVMSGHVSGVQGLNKSNLLLFTLTASRTDLS